METGILSMDHYDETGGQMTTHTTASSEPVATVPHAQPVVHEVLIENTSGRVSLGLNEVWYNRELFYFLTWRDIKVRYKQTGLGVTWAVLQPLASTIVFTLFFNRVANISSGNIPYPVFALSGLVSWTFFANAITQASGSVVASANVVTKIYFPRLIIPTSTVLSGLPDFLVAFMLLLVIMGIYGVMPSPLIVLLPAVLLLVVIAALGVGLWLSALNVKYRDVKYIVPVGVQLWLLASPVVYPAASLPSPWNVLYGINPMVGAIESFRWIVLGGDAPNGMLVALSTTVALLLTVSGAFYFRRTERRFADII